MGEFITDVVDAVKYGFSWLSDRETWKFYAAFLLTGLLLFGVIVGTLAYLLLSIGLSKSSQFTAGFVRHLFSDPMALLSLIIGVFLFMLIVFSAFAILYLFVGMYLMAHALKKRGLSAVPLSMGKFISYIWLVLLSSFYALFCWKDKRFLGILAIVLLLVAGSFANPLLLFPAVLFLLFYLPIVAYMGLRLYFAPMAFLQEELTPEESLDFSWKLSNGRVLGLFARTVASALVINTALSLVGLVPRLAVWVLGLALQFNGNLLVGNILDSMVDAFMRPLSTVALTFATVHIYFVYLQVIGLVGKPGSKPLKKSIRSIPTP